MQVSIESPGLSLCHCLLACHFSQSETTESPTYMKYTARQYFKISWRNNTIVLSKALQPVRRTTIKIQRTRSFPAGVERYMDEVKHRAYT